MRFVLPDGEIAVGRSYSDIVAAMNEAKFAPATNMSTYRKAVAERVQAIYGESVDATSDKTLIKSLCKVGLLVQTG
jgi:hypothetical protein